MWRHHRTVTFSPLANRNMLNEKAGVVQASRKNKQNNFDKSTSKKPDKVLTPRTQFEILESRSDWKRRWQRRDSIDLQQPMALTS